MSNRYIIILIVFIISCSHKQNLKETNQDCVIQLKGNFMLENPKVLNLIDSFVIFLPDYEKRWERKRVTKDNFYLFFIYQSDFFVHIKLGYMQPTKQLLHDIPLGSGYFVYKENVFLVYTGLERICNSNGFVYTGYDTIPKIDSTLLNELESKFSDKILDSLWYNDVTKKMEPLRGLIGSITFDAVLVYDTIIIRTGHLSPFHGQADLLPEELYEQINNQLKLEVR